MLSGGEKQRIALGRALLRNLSALRSEICLPIKEPSEGDECNIQWFPELLRRRLLVLELDELEWRRRARLPLRQAIPPPLLVGRSKLRAAILQAVL